MIKTTMQRSVLKKLNHGTAVTVTCTITVGFSEWVNGGTSLGKIAKEIIR